MEAVSTASATERRYEPTLGARSPRASGIVAILSERGRRQGVPRRTRGTVLMNTRTIAIVALIIAVIVLLLLLL